VGLGKACPTAPSAVAPILHPHLQPSTAKSHTKLQEESGLAGKLPDPHGTPACAWDLSSISSLKVGPFPSRHLMHKGKRKNVLEHEESLKITMKHFFA
jgi:hypothetical protein